MAPLAFAARASSSTCSPTSFGCAHLCFCWCSSSSSRAIDFCSCTDGTGHQALNTQSSRPNRFQVARGEPRFCTRIAGGFAECRNFGSRQIWMESLSCGQVWAHGKIYMFAVCQDLWHTAKMNLKTKKRKKSLSCVLDRTHGELPRT